LGDDDTIAHGVFHNHSSGIRKECSLDYISMHDGATNTLLTSENVCADRWIDMAEVNIGFVWETDASSGVGINDQISSDDLARPSSYHGSGVVVSYCDGHVDFLRDDIDYLVYQHLMTPYGEGAGLTGILDEASF
jgi:prepilin-type processing-associated H-X9-DG protein